MRRVLESAMRRGSQVLVLQSHRQPLPARWYEPCLQSVRSWAEWHGYDYRFVGDELFAALSPEQLEKTRNQRVIAADLARNFPGTTAPLRERDSVAFSQYKVGLFFVF